MSLNNGWNKYGVTARPSRMMHDDSSANVMNAEDSTAHKKKQLRSIEARHSIIENLTW